MTDAELRDAYAKAESADDALTERIETLEGAKGEISDRMAVIEEQWIARHSCSCTLLGVTCHGHSHRRPTRA